MNRLEKTGLAGFIFFLILTLIVGFTTTYVLVVGPFMLPWIMIFIIGRSKRKGENKQP